METRYIAKYKCRLCGKEYGYIATGNEKIAFRTLLRAVGIEKETTENAPAMLEVHACGNGGFGVADLMGYEAVDGF